MFKVSKIQVKNTLEYYNIVNKVLNYNQTVLPNIMNSHKYMAHCLNNFFCQNILNIHNGFPASTLSQDVALVEEFCMSMMDTL